MTVKLLNTRAVLDIFAVNSEAGMADGINPMAPGKAVEIFKDITVDNIVVIMPHNDPVGREHPESVLGVGFDVPVRMVAVNEYHVHFTVIRRKIEFFRIPEQLGDLAPQRILLIDPPGDVFLTQFHHHQVVIRIISLILKFKIRRQVQSINLAIIRTVISEMQGRKTVVSADLKDRPGLQVANQGGERLCLAGTRDERLGVKDVAAGQNHVTFHLCAQPGFLKILQRAVGNLVKFIECRKEIKTQTIKLPGVDAAINENPYADDQKVSQVCQIPGYFGRRGHPIPFLCH